MPNTTRTGPISVDETVSTVAPEAPETGSTPVPAPELPDPTAETVTAGDERPEGDPNAALSLDNALLNGANGDPQVWGAELARFLAALTGTSVDPGSLATLFGAFGLQVQTAAYREAAIAIANNPIVATGRDATTLIALMDLRGDLAELLLGTAR